MPHRRFRNHVPAPIPSAISLNEIGTRTLTREYSIDATRIDEARRTVELSFSSEAEVERWFDEIEVLDHSPGAVDLTRLNGGGNLLFNHNPADPLGVVEEARIDSDRKGCAVVRFGKSARAEEKFQDVKDGILRNVSVGYRIHALEMKEKRDGKTIYVVTRWEPFEVSIVTIPADPSVGVQRNQTNPTSQPSNFRSIMNRQQTIEALRARGITFDESTTDEALAALLHRSIIAEPKNPPPAARPTVTNETQSRSADQERDLVRQITAAGRDYNVREIADNAINDGISLGVPRAGDGGGSQAHFRDTGEPFRNRPARPGSALLLLRASAEFPHRSGDQPSPRRGGLRIRGDRGGGEHFQGLFVLENQKLQPNL